MNSAARFAIRALLLLFLIAFVPVKAHAHRLTLLEPRLHLGALSFDDSEDAEDESPDDEPAWALPSWNAGRWAGSMLVDDAFLPVGALAGGLAAALIADAAGMSSNTTEFVAFGGAVLGGALAMAAATYLVTSPSGARPSYWASVLGGLIGSALTLAVGIYTEDPQLTIFAGAILPALGTTLAGYLSRERVDDGPALQQQQQQQRPRREYPPASPDDSEEEDEEARLQPPRDSPSPARRALFPLRTPVVTLLAWRF